MKYKYLVTRIAYSSIEVEVEADTVLQAIGYALLNTELYGNDVSIQLHNAKN
jgi:hypothetical protein